MTKKLLKQKNIKGLGVLFNTLYLTLPVIGVLSYVGVALTTYVTVVKVYLSWITFPVYITVIIIIVAILMFLFWKFVYLAFFNNPINQNVAKIMEKLGINDEEKK